MNLITVIAINNLDCIRAERLIDQIFALNQKQQKGHAAILMSPDTPKENQDKVRISAEVTFKTVTIMASMLPEKATEKQLIIGSVMIQAAQYINKHYRNPWLWLEPDALPLQIGWQERIEQTYNSQPMRYMNGHLKQLDKDQKELFSITRMGVFPNDAIRDFKDAAALNMGLEYYVHSMSAKCRLFQTIEIKSLDDESKLRPDAVLAHSDKLAVLVDKVTEDQMNGLKISEEKSELTKSLQLDSMAANAPKKRMGRPPKIQPLNA